MDSQFLTVQQRAGPFVKAFSTDRRSFLRRNVDSISEGVRRRCAPALSRTSVDKLELRLALFGFDGIFYSLTFADEFLPQDYEGVCRIWDAFYKRLKRWLRRALDRPLIYYVYRIEGLHGDHRWHIHVFLREQDFPPAVVQYLWDWGEVNMVLYNRERVLSAGGYRALAVYFTKEVPQVGRHPWGCSRQLGGLLPLPEVHLTDTGQLRVPRSAVRLPLAAPPKSTEWGVFSYVRYLDLK